MIVHSFHRNSRELVQVETSDFQGHRGISLRVFYPDEQGELKPGKQGIWLKADLLPELKKAVAALEKELTTLPKGGK